MKKVKLVMVEKQSRILMVWWQLNLMVLAVEGHLFWILRSTSCSQPCVVPRQTLLGKQPQTGIMAVGV